MHGPMNMKFSSMQLKLQNLSDFLFNVSSMTTSLPVCSESSYNNSYTTQLLLQFCIYRTVLSRVIHKRKHIRW